MFTRPFPWFPSLILCLFFASPILSGRPPPTTQHDPFHAIAALAPKPPEEPICCLKPLAPLEPVDDDLFLSFEDWKAKRSSESNTNNQKSNGPPNASTPTRTPAEGRAEAAASAAAHGPAVFDSAAGAHAHAHAPDAVDAAPSEWSAGGSTTPIPPPPVSASPHFRVPLTDRFNYASLDCSARVHTAHGAAKSAANILSSKRDRYMLSPCGAAPQFVVVELCDDIRIDTVQLANFEFFSGVFREFTVSVAKTHAAADAEGWTVVGTYYGKNVRGVQSFHPPTSIRDFYRYIRIDFHSHYSNEYYCPISLLRVYGLTHLEQWKWDTWEEESRARRDQDQNTHVTTVHAEILHEPERPADTPRQVQEDSTTSHDSTSPATPPRDSTTDIQDQGKELSRPSESTDVAQLEPSTSTSSDSPIISDPSSTSSSTPDPAQAINDTTQQSHMFNDSTIASTTTASSSSVYISSRPDNASGTTGSTSRSSQSIVTPISSPSIVIQPSASHHHHPPPPPQVNLPLPPANAHTGESIYRTIMNRLSALEANTTLYARYVEEQTNAMREMLRRLNEDVGRLEGIGRAQAQMYARSISDFEKHRREMDNEQRTLITQVNYLAEEIVMEKRLGIAQLCLLLAVLVFLSVTRGSPGEFHMPSSSSGGVAADSTRSWGQRSLRLSGDWILPSRLRSASRGPPASTSQDSHSRTSTSVTSTTPVSRTPRWPASATIASFLSPPASTHGTAKKTTVATSLAATTPTQAPSSRQKRPPPLFLTPTQQHHQHRVPRSRSSTHAHVRTRSGGRVSPTPIPMQRSSSYGGSFVGGPAVPRSARRWARSAHVHEVRRARQHHHHHHHHQHNHHNYGVDVVSDLSSAGENEDVDVFAASPSSRAGAHHIKSAPLAGSFGRDDEDALVRMQMRKGERGDEGGAGTDTWVDTDTDTDADADADGLWPWGADGD